MALQKSMRASDFLNTIGVNTHLTWEGATDNNAQNVINNLKYTGISSVREEVMPEPGNAPAYARIEALANSGIKFDFMISTYWKNDVPKAISLLHDFAVKHPGSINAIEGLNEVDLWPLGTYNGLTGNDAARAFQQEIFNRINADPVLKDIQVYSYTFADNDLKAGNMSGMADVAATHRYYWGENPQPTKLAGDIASTLADKLPGGPITITETGHLTGNYNDGYVQAVDELTEAKLALNTLFEAADNGAMKTYLFELNDQPDALYSMHYGMYNTNNTPKLQAHALHNLSTILADNGNGVTHEIPLTINGLPSTADSLLMEKADGTYSLAIWNMPDIWDDQRQQAFPAGTIPTTIDFGAKYHSVSVYDPIVGTNAINTYTDVSSITLQTPDHPLIVQFSGSTTTPIDHPVIDPPIITPPADSVQPANITVGRGSDSLILKISQDAYQANAQYKIKVDGRQIGGTLTAQADHDGVSHDTVTVKGDWKHGQHTASITFLNDAWGGTPDTDRNLYLDSSTYNGKVVADADEAFMSAGTASFKFYDVF